MARPVTSEELARLRAERDAADREYNDALTEVDRALPQTPDLRVPPVSPDAGLPASLGGAADVLGDVSLPPARGFRTRLAHFVWRLVAPVFERQQAFNRLVADELGEGRRTRRDSAAALGALATSLRDQADAVRSFQSQLIRYFQQITWYVDTKDRLAGAELMAVYDASIDALHDEALRRAEAWKVNEARIEGRLEDLRRSLAVIQQATQTFKREIERQAAPAPATPPDASQPSSAAREPAGHLDSYKYVCFEDLFRGSREEIRYRLQTYVPVFAGASDVLDVGCGRGEFLGLLEAAGVTARGIDLNHEMVEVCRARGLDVVEGDLVGYLSGLPDGSLGGLIAVQVVEHLEPGYLMRALDLAFQKLRPGSPIVLETINVSSWFAFFSSYLRDLTHVRPLHPETLQFLLTASGFQQARIEYRAPLPEEERLHHVPTTDVESPQVAGLIEVVNLNVDRLNGLLFADLDYAAIAERP